jgi:hypothetical protein
MSDNESAPRKEPTGASIDPVELFDKAAEAHARGVLPDDLFNSTANVSGRLIAEQAFGDCDLSSNYCKFYGKGEVGMCDRMCDVPVWDQI